MPADDHPFDALEHQLRMEDTSVSPVSKIVLHIASFIPSFWPFDKGLAKLKEYIGADSAHRVRVMVETCMNQVRALEAQNWHRPLRPGGTTPSRCRQRLLGQCYPPADQSQA